MEERIYGIGSRLAHPAFGKGVVIAIHKAAYDICFVSFGIKSVGLDYGQFEVIDALPFEPEENYTAAERSLKKILEDIAGISEPVEIAEKWEGGSLVMKPGNSELQSKEIPIDTFFHKIVMVRDRLRIIEQRINASKKLSEEDKVNLQQYITRSYGSLTTFNVLFKYKNDHFKGSSNED